MEPNDKELQRRQDNENNKKSDRSMLSRSKENT
jgi:hypothetical protein